MSEAEEPDWLKSLKKAGEELAEGLAEGLEALGHVFAVSAAMGAMFKGDLDGARQQLDGLPDGQLTAVSVAASALGALADEIAAERGGG